MCLSDLKKIERVLYKSMIKSISAHLFDNGLKQDTAIFYINLLVPTIHSNISIVLLKDKAFQL